MGRAFDYNTSKGALMLPTGYQPRCASSTAPDWRPAHKTQSPQRRYRSGHWLPQQPLRSTLPTPNTPRPWQTTRRGHHCQTRHQVPTLNEENTELDTLIEDRFHQHRHAEIILNMRGLGSAPSSSPPAEFLATTGRQPAPTSPAPTGTPASPASLPTSTATYGDPRRYDRLLLRSRPQQHPASKTYHQRNAPRKHHAQAVIARRRLNLLWAMTYQPPTTKPAPTITHRAPPRRESARRRTENTNLETGPYRRYGEYFGYVASVSALTCYPIKGCTGVPVDHAEVTMTGLPDDRLFAIVEPNGETLWQGEVPRMATIQAKHDGTTLILSAPNTNDLTVEVITDPAHSIDVDVEKWPGTGIDQGDDVAKWLGDFLNRPVRLVREPDRATRARHPDLTALLITSDASLDSLNTRIQRRGDAAVPMTRFRPNIVITGWSDPHTEDRVHRMTIGTTDIGFGERAIRCAMTMTDQATGQRRGPEPLRTLADYRREPDGVSFGLKGTVLTPGHIAINDAVTVTAWR